MSYYIKRLSVIWFTTIHFCSAKTNFQILQNDNDDLELLLSQTLHPILPETNCVAAFSDRTNDHIFGPRFHSTIRNIPIFHVLVEDEEDLLSPNYQTLKLMKAVRRSGCHAYVVIMANAAQVGRFLRFGDRYRELDTRANFILKHDRQLLQPELHYLWKKIINVVFLRKFGSRPGVRSWYELFTVPFPAPIYETLYLRRLDLWRGGIYKNNAQFFRDKTSDLQGELLQVVTFQHIPASFKSPAPSVQADITVDGQGAIGYTGVEIEILRTLSQAMNFDYEIYEKNWGRVSANGSATGLLGEMVAGRAEIGLGDLHHTLYNLRFMDLTIPYTTQCLTFLTPEALFDNSWETLILPFKGYLWTGVLVSLLAGAVMFYILAKFHERMEYTNSTPVMEVQSRGKHLTMYNNLAREPVKLEGLFQFVQVDNTLLYTFSMLLLVSLPKLPAGWSLRVLTGCWWLYSILVVVAYRASMTAILANPAPRVRIDTLEQLAESKIGVGGWDEQTKRFFQTSLDVAGKKIGSRFEIITDVDGAVFRVSKGQFAFYESTDFLRYSSVRRKLLSLESQRTQETKKKKEDGQDDFLNARNLHIMSDCVINMPISLGLQLNSPLKPRMNRYLRLIIQGGLAQKWLRDAMSPVNAAVQTTAKQTQKALMSLKKFLGALVALAAGYIISTLAFFFELIYWRLTVVRHPNYDRYANAIIPTKKVENSFTNERL